MWKNYGENGVLVVNNQLSQKHRWVASAECDVRRKQNQVAIQALPCSKSGTEQAAAGGDLMTVW